MEYAGYDQPADEVWPNMPDFLQAAEVFFGLLFSFSGKALFADLGGSKKDGREKGVIDVMYLLFKSLESTFS